MLKVVFEEEGADNIVVGRKETERPRSEVVEINELVGHRI